MCVTGFMPAPFHEAGMEARKGMHDQAQILKPNVSRSPMPDMASAFKKSCLSFRQVTGGRAHPLGCQPLHALFDHELIDDWEFIHLQSDDQCFESCIMSGKENSLRLLIGLSGLSQL